MSQSASDREEALHLQQDLLRRCMNHAPVRAFIKDDAGRYVFVNEAFAQAMRIGVQDWLGKAQDDLWPSDTARQFAENDRAVLESGRPLQRLETIPCPDGEHLALVLKFPLSDASGRKLLAGLSLDLTDCPEIQDELADHGDRLEERVAARTAALRTLNQQLRQEVAERQRVEQALRESEARFRAVLESSLDAAYRRDLRTDRYDYLSPVIQQITGFSAEELESLSTEQMLERIHPDDRDAVAAELARSMHAGRGKLTYRFHAKDGAYRWLADYVTVAKDADGRPLYYTGIVRDITEPKEAQRRLREQHELLQTVFDHIPAMVKVFDADGRYALVNREWERVLGWRLEEMQGRDMLAELYPDSQYRQQVLQFIQSATREWADFRTRARDGRFVETSWANVRLSDGRTVGIGQDITQRLRAEVVLRRYQLLAENSRDIILFIRYEDGQILEANRAAIQAYGHTHEELLRLTIHDLRLPEDRSLAMRQMAQASASDIRFETLHRRKDGSGFPVEVSSRGTTIGGQSVLLSILRDITERKQAEEKLRQSEALLAEAQKLAHMGSYQFEVPQGTVVWSDETFRLIGRDPTLGAPTILEYMQIVHPDDRTLVDHVVAESVRCNQPFDFEYRLVRPDGSIAWVQSAGSAVADEQGTVRQVVGMIMDITRRKEAEQALRVSEKLAATGRMAAKIAHEINNPLAGIKNSFLLLKDAVPQEHAYHHYVGRIQQEIERISRIVRRMFDVYRPETEAAQHLCLQDLIRDLAALQQASLPRGLRLQLELPPAPVTVVLPESAVRQILLNLLQNALDASPDHGQVTVGLSAGKPPVIAVSDQGSGIAPELRDRIFEPFFTTKGESGQARLGLGLSICQSLAAAIGASLDYASPTGGSGTIFRLTLPLQG